MRKPIVVAAMATCLVTAPAHAGMTSYCQTPPFITTAAAPNVLLMIDTSGSMGWDAYSYGDTDANHDGILDHYDPNKLYEGYFDPTSSYDGTTGVYQVSTTGTCGYQCGATDSSWVCQSNTNGCYYFEPKGNTHCSSNKYACCSQANLTAKNCTDQNSGNYLNYKYMARIDLLRWAMTGGSPAGCNGSIQTCDPGASYPNAQLTCDASGCIMQTNNGIKINVPWSRITGEEGGLLYQLRGLPVQPRMGSMYFSGSGVNQTVLIGDFTGSTSIDGVNPYKNTITALNSTEPNGSTPIGPALWAAYAYLAQNPAVYGGPQPDTGGGNPYKNPMYQCFDLNNDGNCQGNEFALVPCAKNFMILLTDGQWNTPSCNIDTGYESSSSDPVVPAYWLHKKGFTNIATTPQLASKVESLYTIGLWLGGTGATSLKNVAMYGGFDTTSKTWPGNTTGYPSNTCTVDDCGSGKGSSCTSLPPSSSDWDKDGNGIPDTFYGASDALQIKQNIMNIINEILRRASSGTAVSVLSSSQGSGANLMQALFYPQRSFANNTQVAWSSDLMNYWYYLDPFFNSSQTREDTVREGVDYTILNLKQDYITSFAFDPTQGKTLAHHWWDTTGNGTVTVDMGTVPIESTLPIWRAGVNLWWTDPSSRTIKTSVDGSSLISFDTTNAATLDPYLESTASLTAANTIINFTRGYDCVDNTGAACVCGSSGCSQIGRSRTVTTGICSARKNPCNSTADCATGETCTQETHVWKLGDIISSSPRIMGPAPLDSFNLPSPYGYNDQTYDTFVTSTDYQNRQLAFVGANDGMLHSFAIGKLIQNWPGKSWFEVAKEQGSIGVGGIGTEQYAFVPKNVLPYLQYLYDDNYCHLFLVDGPVTITEAAINKPSTCPSLLDYWDCPKLTTMQPAPNSGNVDFANTSWRTVLVGSMGVGGATCNAATPDVNRISTPLAVSGAPTGWSSYFALDVTDQVTPKILWEFSNPDLGVTNPGPALVRVDHKRCTISHTECTTNSDCGDTTVNGVCAKAKRCAISNAACTTNADCGDLALNGQCVEGNGRWLAILASGATGPITDKAFLGTSDKNLKLFVLDLKTGTLLRTIDTGITNAFAGSLTDNVIDLDRDRRSAGGNYQDDAVYIGYIQNTTNGGVLRLVINNDLDPSHWTVSKVIDNIGPVTGSVTSLLDRPNQRLWLYFGEGRYFYKQDDLANQRRLFGVQEPCFDAASNSISPSCTSTVALTDLQDQSTSTSALSPGQKGWYISLDPATATAAAERIITTPTTDLGGAVFFSTIIPNADVCSFGGNSRFWAVDYSTGGPVTYLLRGTILLQQSTGEIKQISLSASSSTDASGRTTVSIIGLPARGGRATDLITGLTGGRGTTAQSSFTPTKRFMHIQER